jgi:hypothetical protein
MPLVLVTLTHLMTVMLSEATATLAGLNYIIG